MAHYTRKKVGSGNPFQPSKALKRRDSSPSKRALATGRTSRAVFFFFSPGKLAEP